MYFFLYLINIIIVIYVFFHLGTCIEEKRFIQKNKGFIVSFIIYDYDH